MDKYKNDIENYLAGKLTPAEMHALEKRALDDPFLADALEGAALIDATDFSKDIAELNQRITKQKSSSWLWPMRFAAAVALVAVSMIAVWLFLKQGQEQTLALQPETSNELPKTQPKIETPLPTETKQSAPAPDTTSPAPQPKKEIHSTTRVKPSKKISTQVRANFKSGNDPLAQINVNQDPGDSLSVPTIKHRDMRSLANIDLSSKESFQLPRANETKLVEGYIKAIDARLGLVTGRVLSAEDGTPLPDVSVELKGTGVITKTDAYGRYSILANSREKTLVYSSEGLESTEVKIDGIDSTYLPVKIEMTDAAQEEAAVETSGMRDFGPTNVYTIPAHPEIGNRAFKQYLKKNYKYPKEARDLKVEGTVMIEFKVDATGALSEFRIVRGIGNGCDEEVIRLILQGAKWIPTTKDGTPVNDKARVKFKFELEE